MKKISLALLVLVAIACKQDEKPQYSVISGTVENNTGETVFIRGNDFEFRTPISEKGTFLDTLHILKDGFYEMYVGRERTSIYLEKGKNLSVTLDANEFDETLNYSGDMANINNFLAAKYLWNEQNLDYKEIFSLPEDDFKKALSANQKSIDSIYEVKKVSNENFKKKLSEEDIYSRAILIENYEKAHGFYTGEANFKVTDGFYDALKNINYKDTLAYRNSTAYQSLLDAHFNRLVREDTISSATSENILFLKKVDEDLPNGYAKDKIMSSYLQFGLKPDETLDEAYSIYKNSEPNSENLAKLTERYNKLKTITKGRPSPTFNYENHKGGTTSLESLKGKYVYIDVWATWCGPCLREIPALKEFEKEYENKNVQVVSISIDEAKDYDKWKSMVTEKQLGGIQLMADNNWKSAFVDDYAIMGIPRFILVDPEGNIVSADAPRPSDPNLKVLLDLLL
ncbi:TlpA family protein disulfide reductase [Aequorivita marisscotiae]|uniref:TlpA disulfide reductase family protein n=1 Tax=Aequorivita marisscotiae TaxID=3040348 RepID=A0ABY8KSE7_9FLAO|nr:TlpA disulfide reductase family protein [Aequorivita sp. Ant34-E75]WGF91948.1 TlpA disulfide reductase family protein [Aequorivita sp. Ant34-E75]